MGFCNQLITGGAPPCINQHYSTLLSTIHPASHHPDPRASVSFTFSSIFVASSCETSVLPGVVLPWEAQRMWMNLDIFILYHYIIDTYQWITDMYVIDCNCMYSISMDWYLKFGYHCGLWQMKTTPHQQFKIIWTGRHVPDLRFEDWEEVRYDWRKAGIKRQNHIKHSDFPLTHRKL